MADWDGKGEPPSRAAAVKYLAKAAKVSATDAEKLYQIYRGASDDTSGNVVRFILTQRAAGDKMDVSGYKAKPVPGATGTKSQAASGAPSQSSAAPGSTEDYLNTGPGGAVNTKGAPLLPYAIPEGTDPTTLKFDNRSRMQGGHQGSAQISARYYESDTLTPLKWSPEDRAKVQRILLGLGLYGDKSVRLGSWSADDQAIYAELLTNANVDGRTMQDELDYWKRVPPTELLAKIKAAGGTANTITVSNPLDIRQVASNVDKVIAGGGTPGFVEGAVAPVQQTQIDYQKNANANVGGQNVGGQNVGAPDIEGYLADKMRREHPIEVAGHSFLKAFDVFSKMFGSEV